MIIEGINKTTEVNIITVKVAAVEVEEIGDDQPKVEVFETEVGIMEHGLVPHKKLGVMIVEVLVPVLMNVFIAVRQGI
jgi:hypothetical protein